MSSPSAGVRIGYNTNGFPFHRLDDAIEILAGLGYRGIALTPDVHHLDPFRATANDILRVRRSLERFGLTCVVETGARFLLDPRRKHWPTLLSREHQRVRIEFLQRCMRLATQLGASVVSFWTGAAEGDSRSFDEDVGALRDPCFRLLDDAERLGVTLALEPEPGMRIDGLDAFRRFDAALGDARLALTLDVGHLQLTESKPPESCLRDWSRRLRNVHLDDTRRPIHEHLAFGDGEIAFEPVLHALREIQFAGLASVELSRHGHDAVETAKRAIRFLQPLAGSG